MKTHRLKTNLEYFEQVWNGNKTFEVRLNDRDFQVGDKLYLMEWNQFQSIFTGRYIERDVRYIMRDGNGFLPLGDMVIMAIK